MSISVFCTDLCFYISEIERSEGAGLDQLLKDRYDTELELSKNLMQQEFDEILDTEKVKLFSVCLYIYCAVYFMFTFLYIMLKSNYRSMLFLVYVIANLAVFI